MWEATCEARSPFIDTESVGKRAGYEEENRQATGFRVSGFRVEGSRFFRVTRLVVEGLEFML